MRLLVVEDDPRTADLLRRGLTDAGYAVDVVGDGLEALWQAGEVAYDAVVLDRMLPGADGVEVCRRLRADHRWTPVLMLTARSEVEDRVAGLDAGADDYLAKPFSFAELEARLRALVRREAHPRPAVLTCGPISLDPATRVVYRSGRSIELSPKEFALLEVFMRRPGETLSRATLLEHAWDWAYDGDSNLVDQYVAYLRRKLDRPFSGDQFRTVRGVGYRLVPDESV